MSKIYQKKGLNTTQSTIRLNVRGKSKTIMFESKRKNGLLHYETTDTEIQKAIEETNYYQEGVITCVSGGAEVKKPAAKKADDTDAEAANAQTETVSYPEVTGPQAAKEILKSEPYNVPFQALTTPANILKKAAELGVLFPNIVVE